MAEVRETRGMAAPVTRAGVRTTDRGFQAYKLLQLGFIVVPTIAGLDKFFHLLANWDQYLAPQIARVLPISAQLFMLIVGLVELAAGLLVALKPRIGAYLVAVWLGAIVANLLIHRSYFDIALRDFGLLLGALALGRLSRSYQPGRRRVVATP